MDAKILTDGPGEGGKGQFLNKTQKSSSRWLELHWEITNYFYFKIWRKIMIFFFVCAYLFPFTA